MGGIDRRIRDLEAQFGPPEDEGSEVRRAVMRGILDEISSLRSPRARNSYRGGSPPTPIQPTDPAGEHFGYPYTTGELTEYAIRRVLEREGAPDTEEAVEEWVAHWRRIYEELGHDWDKVQAEGPPERTPPWRGGY